VKKSVLALGLVLVMAAVLLTACGGGSKSGGAAGKTIDMKMTEFAFEPKEVTVKQGEAVTVNLVNQGSVAHSFEVDEFGAKSDSIPAGQSGKVTFTPNKTGEFTIYCFEPGHKDSGMTAKLIVQ